MSTFGKWGSQTKAKGSRIDAKPNIPHIGIMHVNAMTKNLSITVTDLNGRVYNFVSGGMTGQRNFKKKTATNAEEMLNRISRESHDRGLRNIHIRVKGFYYNRNTVLRQIGSGPFQVLTLSDVTPIPHGGCLPKKARRK